MLQELFFELCFHYTQSQPLAEKLWKEIETCYTEQHRHYHTLAHLENLVAELLPYKEKAGDWDILLFSVFYHDIIYNIPGSSNEEKSAELAAARLKQLGIPPERIALCREQILATKTHTENTNFDTNLFTDADLAILGKPEVQYDEYTIAIGKEYHIYPLFLYKNGRRSFLKHFLSMEHLYKTNEFREKYEAQARENLELELVTLS
ncbi:MAG: hypothetical protein JNL72_08495 [Flavipsychrobacter sp.]|nr:hypothetical protein [Flavipsychrobacter sp.]